MTTEHSAQTFAAGENWQIEATLWDNDGNPVDLTNVDLKWFLVDQNHRRVIDSEGVRIRVKDRPRGKCLVTVAAETTAKLTTGAYSDFVRLTLHNGPGTTALLRTIAWRGPIKVTSSAS